MVKKKKKFNYELRWFGTANAKIKRFAKTKKEAEKVKKNMVKANFLNRKIGVKPRFRKIRIVRR